MNKEFTLSWKQAAKIFDNNNYQDIYTLEGEKLTLKKIKDIENWSINKYSPIYENNGTLLIHCKNNDKLYKTRYMEYGDIKQDMQMFIGDYYFTELIDE